MAGHVTVDGRVVTKAGTLVDPDADVILKQADHPWVGRGGIKLAHALEIFQIDVSGALALDIGASTGGFTDVLLQRGARRVVALDVGHNQIDWRLRTDPASRGAGRRERPLLEAGWPARRCARVRPRHDRRVVHCAFAIFCRSCHRCSRHAAA